jgi:hypothetical protein
MIPASVEALLKHMDLDAVLLLGMGYMTTRARRWLESPVLPRDAMEQPAQKMMEGEMQLLDLIVQQIRHFNKPILPVIDLVGFDMEGEGNIVKHLDALGIMTYSSPEQAIRALTRAQDYYRKRRVTRIAKLP